MAKKISECGDGIKYRLAIAKDICLWKNGSNCGMLQMSCRRCIFIIDGRAPCIYYTLSEHWEVQVRTAVAKMVERYADSTMILKLKEQENENY